MKLHFLILLILLSCSSVFGQLLPEPVSKVPQGIVPTKAIYFGRPQYPPEARGRRIKGTVIVQVTINEQGEVISAVAESGDPIFHQAAENAARQSRFTPTMINGKPVRITGRIVFNFILQTDWENVGSDLLSILENTAVIEANPNNANNDLGEGFEAEAKEFAALHMDESTEGKQRRAANLINLIRYKLSSHDPMDLWLFNLGIITSGINHNVSRIDSENIFYTYLQELAELVKTAPTGISPKRLATLKEMTEYSNKKSLSKEKRVEINRILTESRNDYLNGVY